MKIWAFCVFMPQKLQDMSSFLGFGGNSALLHCILAGFVFTLTALYEKCSKGSCYSIKYLFWVKAKLSNFAPTIRTSNLSFKLRLK